MSEAYNNEEGESSAAISAASSSAPPPVPNTKASSNPQLIVNNSEVMINGSNNSDININATGSAHNNNTTATDAHLILTPEPGSGTQTEHDADANITNTQTSSFRNRFLSPSLDLDGKSALLVDEFAPRAPDGWPSMDTPCAALLDLWLDRDLALDDKLTVLEEWICALAFSQLLRPGAIDSVGTILQMIASIQEKYKACTPMSGSHSVDFMNACEEDLNTIASVVLGRFAFDVPMLIDVMTQADVGELTPAQTMAVSLLQTRVIGVPDEEWKTLPFPCSSGDDLRIAKLGALVLTCVRQSISLEWAWSVPSIAAIEAIKTHTGGERGERVLLDIGCGSGYWVKRLCEAGVSARGFDIVSADADDNTFVHQSSSASLCSFNTNLQTGSASLIREVIQEIGSMGVLLLAWVPPSDSAAFAQYVDVYAGDDVFIVGDGTLCNCTGPELALKLKQLNFGVVSRLALPRVPGYFDSLYHMKRMRMSEE